MNSINLRRYSVISLLIFSLPSFSEEEESEKLGDITVTAQKIERSLQDTKESVAVVTAEQIENTAIFDINDVYNRTANVYDTGFGESFGIRGITQSAASTGGGSGELGTLYIDGVAYTGFSSRFNSKNLWDIDQIEILRGPQSTNVGRNALIGAVAVKSARPDTAGFDAAARLDIGNFNQRNVEAMINTPAGDRSAFRLTAEYGESDGFMTNATLNTDDFDARETRLIRAQYLFEASEDLSVNFTAQKAETFRGQDIYRSDLQPLYSRTSSANLAANEDYDGTTFSIHLDYEINNNWSINSITSYLDGEYDRFDDDDEGPEGGDAFRGRTGLDKNWAEEFRLNYRSGKWLGALGFYYTEVDITNNTTGLVNIFPAFVGVPDSLLPFYPDVLKIDVFAPFEEQKVNTAFFTEWDYLMTEKTTLSFGFRYDNEEQDVLSNTANSLSPDTPLPDPVVAGMIAEQLQPGSGAAVEGGVTQVNALLLSQLIPTDIPRQNNEYDAFLPQVGITHKFRDNLSLSAFYKQGYRAGGVEVNLAGNRAEYDPETLNNFEVSLRSNFWGGKGYLNANVYYGDWQDQQVQVCLDGNIFNCATENSGESEIYGAEFDFQYSPNDQTVLYASLGLSHTEFTRFISGTEGDLSGNEFGFSPEVTASIGMKHYFSNQMYISGNVNYQDKMFADTQNNRPLDSRVLLNMKVGYDFDQYSFSIYGRNLTDKDYLTSNGLGISAGNTLARLGNPREYGIQIAYRY